MSPEDSLELVEEWLMLPNYAATPWLPRAIYSLVQDYKRLKTLEQKYRASLPTPETGDR